jgi:hypothetical protein
LPRLDHLSEEDPRIGHNVMYPMVKALAERLQATRVQLAAARA